jgi:hypothetical protein
MFLRHSRLSAVEYIVDKLPAVWQLDLAAVDVVNICMIDQKQVIAAGTPGDVDMPGLHAQVIPFRLSWRHPNAIRMGLPPN